MTFLDKTIGENKELKYIKWIFVAHLLILIATSIGSVENLIDVLPINGGINLSVIDIPRLRFVSYSLLITIIFRMFIYIRLKYIELEQIFFELIIIPVSFILWFIPVVFLWGIPFYIVDYFVGHNITVVALFFTCTTVSSVSSTWGTWRFPEELKKDVEKFYEDVDEFEDYIGKTENKIESSQVQDAAKCFKSAYSCLQKTSDNHHLYPAFKQRIDQSEEKIKNLSENFFQEALSFTNQAISDADYNEACATLDTIEEIRELSEPPNEAKERIQSLNEQINTERKELAAEKIDEAHSLIRRANRAADEGNISQAYQHIKSSKELINQVQKMKAGGNTDDIKTQLSEAEKRVKRLESEENISKGGTLFEEASEYREADEYDRALEAYEKAQAAYEEALESASDSDIDLDTKSLKKTLVEIKANKQDIHYQRLQGEIDTLGSTFEQAETLTEQKEFEKAQSVLEDLNSDITAVKDNAAGKGFDDLNEDLTTLQQSQQDRLTYLTKKIESNKELSSLRGKLGYVTRLINNNEFETAYETLSEIKPRLETLERQADKHDFQGLSNKVSTLEKRYEDRLEKVTQQLEPHLDPDTIPRAPDISVKYDALIDREPIGGGGNADVTKATLPTPDGDVTLAIKEPRMSGTLHTDAIRRMLEEAETWDKLDDHDYIVGVVDYGSAPIPWIAMEYMDAGHLGEKSGQMDIPQALWTAIGVTKAVRHAHRRGVAHLDLKPENVLFRSVGDAWDVPKVADWGLSRHLLEHSKSVEGLSPQYAAPEQFDDEYGSADDITDIYQLGAVFYELFTGEPPFDGKPAKAMHKVLHEEPTGPSEIADVPQELDEILLTALAKEKDDRYDNVAYLRDALQDVYEEY